MKITLALALALFSLTLIYCAKEEEKQTDPFTRTLSEISVTGDKQRTFGLPDQGCRVALSFDKNTMKAVFTKAMVFDGRTRTYIKECQGDFPFDVIFECDKAKQLCQSGVISTEANDSKVYYRFAVVRSDSVPLPVVEKIVSNGNSVTTTPFNVSY